jgi:high-affinity nickel-transport protein
MSTTFLLGLRHGVDWDHLAAILDIVSNQEKTARAKTSKEKWKSLSLATSYSLGHAFVVVVLGVAAISFKAILPSWIDPLMERVVGVTLLALGLMVLYSLKESLSQGGDLQIKSRFSLLAGLAQKLSKEPHSHLNRANVGVKTSFAIGMIHAIGAETATQLLLITAVGSTSEATGLGMLFFFCLGLVAANTLIALLAIAGLGQTAGARPVILITGFLTAAFSLYLGIIFILGRTQELPELGNLFRQPPP